ncbi:hypothetical protein HK405_007013, partial [Cladochytrium tenue]
SRDGRRECRRRICGQYSPAPLQSRAESFATSAASDFGESLGSFQGLDPFSLMASTAAHVAVPAPQPPPSASRSRTSVSSASSASVVLSPPVLIGPLLERLQLSPTDSGLFHTPSLSAYLAPLPPPSIPCPPPVHTTVPHVDQSQANGIALGQQSAASGLSFKALRYPYTSCQAGALSARRHSLQPSVESIHLPSRPRLASWADTISAQPAARKAVSLVDSIKYPPPGALMEELADAPWVVSRFIVRDIPNDSSTAYYDDRGVRSPRCNQPFDFDYNSDRYPSSSTDNYVEGLAACLTTPVNVKLPDLRSFITKLMKRTDLSASTLALAMLLLLRIGSRWCGQSNRLGLFPGEIGTAHRMAFVAVMVASKVLYDDTYDNRAWCTVSSRLFSEPSEISPHERAFLALLDFELNADRSLWMRFTAAVDAATEASSRGVRFDHSDPADAATLVAPLLDLARRDFGLGADNVVASDAEFKPKACFRQEATSPGSPAPVFFALIHDDSISAVRSAASSTRASSEGSGSENEEVCDIEEDDATVESSEEAQARELLAVTAGAFAAALCKVDEDEEAARDAALRSRRRSSSVSGGLQGRDSAGCVYSPVGCAEETESWRELAARSPPRDTVLADSPVFLIPTDWRDDPAVTPSLGASAAQKMALLSVTAVCRAETPSAYSEPPPPVSTSSMGAAVPAAVITATERRIALRGRPGGSAAVEGDGGATARPRHATRQVRNQINTATAPASRSSSSAAPVISAAASAVSRAASRSGSAEDGWIVMPSVTAAARSPRRPLLPVAAAPEPVRQGAVAVVATSQRTRNLWESPPPRATWAAW